VTDTGSLASRLFPRAGNGFNTSRPQARRTRQRGRPAAGDIFRQEPVSLSEFVTGREFLNNPPLSDIQFDAVRHLEQVYLPSTYELMVEEFGAQWEPVRFVDLVVLQWAKAGGKDHVCRVATARAAYLLLCLRDPQSYFGMPGQDSIHLLNVAASEAQARTAFFKPLRRMIERAPCFAGRFEMKAGAIEFDNGVELLSGHSSAQTQEGLNLLLGIADEIAAFRSREETAHLVRASGREPAGTGEKILEMMITSARTRFPENFKVAAISYPRLKGDLIQRLTAQGREDNERHGERSRWYVSGPYATWQVNPRVPSKDAFRDDYERDPMLARAKYECAPDVRLNRLFRDDRAVYAAFDQEIPEPVRIDYLLGRPKPDAGGASARLPYGWQAQFDFSSGFRPVPGALYAVHADLSLRRSRTGIAMAHVRAYEPRDEQDDERIADLAPTVKVDFVASFEADLEAQPVPREIRLSWVRDLLRELQRLGFPIARVSFDDYQSADSAQTIASWGIETDIVSTAKTPRVWETLREVTYEGRLEGYWRSRLVKELLELMILPGGKVRAPVDGSKDEADALACAVLGAIELGGQERTQASVPASEMFSVGEGLTSMREWAAWGVRSWQDLGPGRWPGGDMAW
jgi:hypothetical protein